MPAAPRRRIFSARTVAALVAASTLAFGAPPLVAGAAPSGPVAPTTIAEGNGIPLTSTSRPVAEGVELTSFERLESDKWMRADAVSVDLDGSARVDYLAGNVAQRKTVAQLAEEHDPGPGRRTVAAINADFFDINETGSPLGAGIRDGKLTQSAAAGSEEAVGFGPDSAGRLLKLYFEGTLTLPSGVKKLDSFNAANVPAGGIGAYTSLWGTADRKLTVDGAARVTEVAVKDGTVVSVAGQPGSGAIPEGTTVLLGKDAGAGTLATLVPGDAVAMEYRPVTDNGPVPRTAVGGRGVLVLDGEPQDWEGRPNNTSAPRTAVGFSQDGTEMHVLSVDGRMADAGGVTLTELALMMDKLGAHSALNLDGGGSSTLLVREPGSDTPQLENTPSDGFLREVPNGLAITAPDGSERLRGFWVETAADKAKAPSADQVPGGHPERVFPGLTRKLTAAGYDETYGPADGRPGWISSNPGAGVIDPAGVFHAHHSGSTKVTAFRGTAKGSTRLTVIGALDRIRSTNSRVGLADAKDEAGFGIVGHDAHGNSAPIDPADVRLEYDRDLFDISPDAAAGGFTVTADGTTSGTVSGQVKAIVRGTSTVLGVTVGLQEQDVASFDDGGEWTFTAARATGSLTPVPDGRTGQGLKISYDFSQSTGTRAAYANPPAEIPVPGQPQSFGLWIKGDARAAWPSLHLRDANGTSQVLRGPHITWEGWQKVTFEVPRGIAYPLRVVRFYIAETVPASQYQSEIVIDDLTAQTPPDVEIPAAPVERDRLIGTAQQAGERDWRYAVMSDAQFVARDPDSDIVRQARRTLREIKAARPDFLVINGDLVDEGSPADLAFARQVIEEELGDSLPWHYVPGNHEVMGGKIDNFVREFGPAQLTFDHKGARFITLDTSSLTVRGGGFAQIQQLRERLAAAAEDPAISSVTVIEHVPPRDPTSLKASQLNDRKEADLLEDWLGDFRRETGKGAFFIGSHVGAFHAEHVDGVPYLINGNSGKNPSTPPGEGGFTGWSMIGVDKVSRVEQKVAKALPYHGRPDWVTVQTRAHVDALALDAPDTIGIGEERPVSATVGQGPVLVPVSWPLSADWKGTDGLYIGAGRASHRAVASYDPVAGTLTGLRPGQVTLSVTVNGVTKEVRVSVTR